MIDLEMVYERDMHVEHSKPAGPVGVIAVGFLLMLAGFPVFLILASSSASGVPWLACILSLMLEIAGIGLVATAQWARAVAVFSTFLTSVVLTILLVIYSVMQIPRTSIEFATMGPTMAVLGFIMALLVIILPAFMVMGYLGSREVKDMFRRMRYMR